MPQDDASPRTLEFLGYQQRLRAVRERCRTDVQVYLEHVLTTDKGVPVVLAPIHRSWLHHISWCWDHGYHALILAPFAHAKSTIIAIGLTSFLLGREKDTRIKLVCNEGDAAQDRVQAVGKILRDSSNFRQVFPGCIPADEAAVRKVRRSRGGRGDERWNLHELWLERSPGAVSHNASLEAKGVMATGVGGRCDYLVFDDIVDQRNSVESPADRKKVVRLAEDTWESRMDPGSHGVAIGTVWHQEDYWHHLMRRPDWITLRQSVNDEMTRIDQEVFNAPRNYPGQVLDGHMERDPLIGAG